MLPWLRLSEIQRGCIGTTEHPPSAAGAPLDPMRAGGNALNVPLAAEVIRARMGCAP
jgi:hypothetical protein